MNELAWPLHLAPGGDLGSVVSGSDAEVRQSVGLLLATRVDERAALPEYGTTDPTFDGADRALIVAEVQAQEPRASLDVVVAAVDVAHQQLVTVSVASQTAEGS